MKIFLLLILTIALFFSCNSIDKYADSGPANVISSAPLPAPYATDSTMNFSNVLGWKNGRVPLAPGGFTVTLYAKGFDNPRWMYVLPNGDLLVAESNSNHSDLERFFAPLIGADKSNNLGKSADRITLIRESNSSEAPDMRETFIGAGLRQPFGMLVLGNWFYVANTDSIVRYHYEAGQTTITGQGEKIASLPAGNANRHWARNLIANRDKTKIYVSVGSGSNVAENGIANEVLRANILEMNPDGTGLHIYASGLRNPNGMAWAPGTDTLWAVVNERDELGDNLVPDYLTSVRENGFYGWPYSYWGAHVDPRVKDLQPELVKNAIVPDVNLGNHHAPLGLMFYEGQEFPKKYQGGAFIGEHGSWNSKNLAGYRVAFVPFKDGKPTGPPEDFLTGFLPGINQKDVFGRPVGVIELPDGSILVTDDFNNSIWKITADK